MVEYHYDKARLLRLLMLGILMLAASYFCTTLDTIKAQVAGWAGLLLFGAVLAKVVFSFFVSSAQVIISEVGILDRRFGVGVIPWSDIAEVRMQEMRSHAFLCIYVRDENAYLDKCGGFRRIVARMNRGLGYSSFTISFGGLEGSAEEAMYEIQKLRPQTAVG